ncbi:hypothetical protein ACE6H2_003089 [Prunus campanulata]
MAQDMSGVDSHQRRQGLLKDQVRLVKKKDSHYEIAPIQSPLSFEKGFFIVIRACQLLAQKNDGIILVGVAGPSGAGKTVFTEKILNFMPSVAVISMDNYNDASRIVDGNFDDPRLTDYDTLLQNINDLKAGKEVQVPVYDFKSSSRTGFRTVEVPSSRIVIIEGIYALSEKLRPFLDLRVSVTGGVHFDLVKRVLRDIQRAGQEPEEIIHQISETSAKDLSADQIKAVFSEDHTEAKEETYDIYLLPPGEDPESCQSYLRMRDKDGKYSLMFEEWVTDNPFVISPRITFEVSVRLLGGLMALGYTIATILKRSSHVFSNDGVCVKIDWLEQLNRRYIQVQGKDRVLVRCVAEQLGLEGSYIPRTYIEQIQLEKLVNEVMALPDDLKTRLSLDEDLVSSPKEALSRASADRVAMRNKHLKSGMSQSYTTQRDKSTSKLTGYASNSQRFDERNSESSATLASQGVVTQLSEQMSSLNDRMDEFTNRVEELNSKLAVKKSSPSQQNMALQAETCNGSVPTSYFISGLGNGSLTGSILPNSSSSSQLAKESSVMEESIIESILTHLPIRDAIRTSCLSTKWRYKWTTLTHLAFDEKCVTLSNDRTLVERTLIDFITRALFLHQGPVHKFQLSTSYLQSCPDIDQWILFLSRNDIKELVLELGEGEWFRVPSCLFYCKKLTRLELFRCELDPPPAFKGFLCLKSLNLHQVLVAPDAIESLISSCPLLESLALSYFDSLALNIRAPNLKYLCLEGEFKDICLENTPLLVAISVAMYMTDDIAEHFEQSSNCNFIKFLGGIPRLERLVGHIYFTKGSSNTLAAIEASDLDFWEKQCPSDCAFGRLKVVKMTDMSGVPHEMEFIKFLLKKSPVLETMSITPCAYVLDGRLNMLIELVSFKRASPEAEILFIQD